MLLLWYANAVHNVLCLSLKRLHYTIHKWAFCMTNFIDWSKIFLNLTHKYVNNIVGYLNVRRIKEQMYKKHISTNTYLVYPITSSSLLTGQNQMNCDIDYFKLWPNIYLQLKIFLIIWKGWVQELLDTVEGTTPQPLLYNFP